MVGHRHPDWLTRIGDVNVGHVIFVRKDERVPGVVGGASLHTMLNGKVVDAVRHRVMNHHVRNPKQM